jgi:glycosyltransferase involved in cell wall biosynthesis
MVSYYYYPEYSGSAKQAASLIKNLKINGVQSFIISAQLNTDWPLDEIVEGIKIYRVPLKQKSLFAFWFGVAKLLWKLRGEYDIVHCHGMNPFHGFPLFFANLLGKRSLGKLSIANSDIDFKNQGRLVGNLHSFFLKKADRYIAISSALQEEVKTSGLSPDKCRFIPNGVDTKRFYPISNHEKINFRKQLNLPPNKMIVLFVGVIDYRKGVDVLLPAFKRVLETEKDVILVLVGPANRVDKDGSFYKKMTDFVKTMNIESFIHFFDESDQIQKYYQMADLFVLPSRQEGMPNAVLEAMACGLPVIGTTISGTMDIIPDDKFGILSKPGDEFSLSQALKELIRNKSNREQISKNVIERINHQFSLNKISSYYINEYKSLL